MIKGSLDFGRGKIQGGLFVELIKTVEPVFPVGIERPPEIEKDCLAILKFSTIHHNTDEQISKECITADASIEVHNSSEMRVK
jgi:hypothetical protein